MICLRRKVNYVYWRPAVPFVEVQSCQIKIQIELRPSFLFSKIWGHDNLIFDKQWFDYIFMDLCVMTKFSLFAAQSVEP